MLKNFLTKDHYNEDQTLNVKLIAESLTKGSLLVKELSKLPPHSLDSLFHVLITHKCYKALGQILSLIEKESLDDLDFYKVLTGLSFKKARISSKVLTKEIPKLKQDQALRILSFYDELDSSLQTLLKTVKKKATLETEEYKADLIEQVKFLEQQKLNEKANEIQQKLEFHFPEIKSKNENSNKTNTSGSNSILFSKVIERNLSFDLRTKKRINKKALEKINHRSLENQKFLNAMVSSWYDEFKNQAEIFIIQLEFLLIESTEIYENLLKKEKNLDFWTKVELLLKIDRDFEGLSLLLSKEKEILDKNNETVYNYYYYKALFYRKIGMTEEAEKIFKALYEQKQNFRDVNFYLKN